MAQLASVGVRTLPYINGRIFDNASASYVRDDGGQFCVQDAAPVFGGKTNLTMPVETYGSGAFFNVPDPSTSYWQYAIAEVIEKLVTVDGVAGVYVDQLVRLCLGAPQAT